MQYVNVEVEGLPPGLLMHRFPMEPIEAIEKKPVSEQAEISAYRVPSGNGDAGELYIPGTNIRQALVAGATYAKGKGRGSLQKQCAASVFVTPEYVLLGTKKYEIDLRPVVIKATGGRIIRARPHLAKWAITFRLEYDERLISAIQMREIVEKAFTLVGVLDYRPATKGPFGRGMITRWEQEK